MSWSEIKSHRGSGIQSHVAVARRKENEGESYPNSSGVWDPQLFVESDAEQAKDVNHPRVLTLLSACLCWLLRSNVSLGPPHNHTTFLSIRCFGSLNLVTSASSAPSPPIIPNKRSPAISHTLQELNPNMPSFALPLGPNPGHESVDLTPELPM